MGGWFVTSITGWDLVDGKFVEDWEDVRMDGSLVFVCAVVSGSLGGLASIDNVFCRHPVVEMTLPCR